jgi:hypothetical protein
VEKWQEYYASLSNEGLKRELRCLRSLMSSKHIGRDMRERYALQERRCALYLLAREQDEEVSAL